MNVLSQVSHAHILDRSIVLVSDAEGLDNL